MTPKCPKVIPILPQTNLKVPPKCPKVAPKCPKVASKWLPSDTKLPQSDIKVTQSGPQVPQSGPQVSESHPQVRRSASKVTQSAPQVSESTPQVTPESLKGGRKTFLVSNICKSEGLDASKPRSLAASKCLGGNREAKSIEFYMDVARVYPKVLSNWLH